MPPFAKFWDNAAFRQGLLLILTCLALWVLARSFDFFDLLDEMMHAHEDWQLDEIMFAFMMAGHAGIAFCILRIRDLGVEIARRNRAERDVAWIASHDPLTRLANRRGLEEEIVRRQAMTSLAPTAALSIDLDGFKKVNDLFGHHAGDEALVEVATRLRTLAPHDGIFRTGGDEFLVLVDLTRKTDVEALAHGIVASLSEPYRLQGVTAEMGASVGIATCPDQATDLRLLMQYADLAMYSSKRDRNGRVTAFDRSMSDGLAKRNQMELDLREALKSRAIVPHFQPLVDLKSGELRGFEALARWTSAAGIAIPPSDFIVVAEETGLITELSEQLLHRACLQARNWPAPLRLAFNLSPAQLADKMLGLRILRILGETGLSPDRLEIEITESALVGNVEVATIVLEDLINAGIHIALDDFGTGYSSLSHLSKFSFEKIKIDRSFIGTFETEAKQEKIVRAIVGLGQGLGLATTAEGIETGGQAEALTRMGCDYGQGYYFGKAMSEAQLADYLRESDRRMAG
jgi:diguanylate cyclase (GGDEF)-like protein